MTLLHFSTGNLSHFLAVNYSNSSMFEGSPPCAVFSSRHRLWVWFRSRSSLAAPEQSSDTSWTISGCFCCIFGVVDLLEDPQPSTETLFLDTGLNITLQNTMIICWFYVLHTFNAPSIRGSKATQQHYQTAPRLILGRVLFSLNALFSRW